MLLYTVLEVYRYKARNSGKGAQRSAGGIDNIAIHLVAINYPCFVGKIDGTCGAFLSVVTPGDCRREARLHLNRWHCEHREKMNLQYQVLKDGLTYNFISRISGQNLVNKGTYQAEEGTACFYRGLYSVCTRENTATLSYPWLAQFRDLEREKNVKGLLTEEHGVSMPLCLFLQAYLDSLTGTLAER